MARLGCRRTVAGPFPCVAESETTIVQGAPDDASRDRQGRQARNIFQGTHPSRGDHGGRQPDEEPPCSVAARFGPSSIPSHGDARCRGRPASGRSSNCSASVLASTEEDVEPARGLRPRPSRASRPRTSRRGYVHFGHLGTRSGTPSAPLGPGDHPLERPASSQAGSSPRPGPRRRAWQGTCTRSRIARTASTLTGRPALAPSRSTRWIRDAPSASHRAAIAAGSSPKIVSWS